MCSGCGKSEKERFIEKLENDKGFVCDESTCIHNQDIENHINGIDMYSFLVYTFNFNANDFTLGYSYTSYQNNETVTDENYVATYNYENDEIFAKKGVSTIYEYNYQTHKLVKKEIYSMYNKSYDCLYKNDKDISEKCSYLKEKCEDVKGMFYNYLGDYSINDLIE